MARLTRILIAVVLSGATVTLPGLTHAADSGVYVVKNGDSLSAIASRLDVRLADLLSANGLTVTSVIFPGQELRVPGAGGGGSSSGAQYTVVRGDNLSGIATRHGVTLNALIAANGLNVNSVIQPGQKLTIPGASGGGGPSNVPPGPRYTVKSGDSLGAIAARHNVSLNSLLAVNQLTANSLITPGMQLTLPAGASVSRIDAVLNYAVAQVGRPYRFWSAGPSTFDCSGLTLAAYGQIGVSLVHYSGTQATQGTAVDFWNEAIRPGDLVFMATAGDGKINHVGIAINATVWVQARESRGVVTMGPIPPDSMIVTVRRLVPAT